MKLVVRYSDYFNIDVIGGCVIVNYPMDCTLEEVLNKNKEELIRLLNLEINNHNSYFVEQLLLLYGLNSESDTVSLFKQVDMDYPSEEVIPKLFSSFKNISIPVVFDAMDLNDDYLLENIGFFDNCLKENGVSNISYVIKQCVDDRESHNENVSYPIEDVLLVLNYIKDVTSNIKKFNLSPLEQVMFIYDLVKDRYYKEEAFGEAYLESRDMAKILKGDKIVCLGFSYLFKSLLDSMNIPNTISFLEGIESNIGHARVIVGIEDEKYNLNHVLYFDPTWDSKSQKDSYGLLDKYNNFARNKFYFMKKDRTKGLIESDCLPFKNDFNEVYRYKIEDRDLFFQVQSFFKLINWKKYFKECCCSEYDFDLNKLMETGMVDFFNPNTSGFDMFIYKECSRMLNRKLYDDVFFRCLYTVRRVENYLYPDKYSCSNDILLGIYADYMLKGHIYPNSKNVKSLYKM